MAPTAGRPRPRRASATCSAPTSETFLVWNGTGANVMALATMVAPGRLRAVHRWAHIYVDETGAPERVARRQAASPSAAADAKLRPEQIERAGPALRATCTTPNQVSSRSPRAPSSARSTPPTRLPRCATRRTGLGMVVHMDGARLANATAALGGTRGRGAIVHGRCRRRRAQLRRHEGRLGRRRGRGVPQSEPRASVPSTCASRSTSCPRRCASSPPSSTPCSTMTGGSVWPSTPTPMSTRLYELTSGVPSRHSQWPSSCEQPVPIAPARE